MIREGSGLVSTTGIEIEIPALFGRETTKKAFTSISFQDSTTVVVVVVVVLVLVLHGTRHIGRYTREAGTNGDFALVYGQNVTGR